MADFDPTIFSGQSWDVVAAKAAIQDLAVFKQNAAYSSLTSYAPSDTTLAQISNLTATVTMNTDEYAYVQSSLSLSGGSTSDIWIVRLEADGTPAENPRMSFDKVDTTGKNRHVTIHSVFDNKSGSTTFTTKWGREAASGNTIYSFQGNLTVMVFKVRTS